VTDFHGPDVFCVTQPSVKAMKRK